MEDHPHNFFASKASIVGLFAVLSAALTIPVVILTAQQPQTLRGNASGPEINQQLSPTSASRQENIIIAGYVYHDQNRDGQRNNQEKPFPDGVISITEMNKVTKENRIIELKTDNFGYFTYTASVTPSGDVDYIIKTVLPDGYKTITTNPVLFSELQNNKKQIIEFGLYNLKETTTSPQPTTADKKDFLIGD